MTASGLIRGVRSIWDGEKWAPGSCTAEAGHCGECDRNCEVLRPDPCLGWLPGVSHACCGHGDSEEAYVVLGGAPDQPISQIEGPTLTLRGQPAIDFFNLIEEHS